ncbi:hypothetical protein BOX15_Mlig002333g1 [Macrostomum lignano]|uniref:LRRNT domain-containing protein n=1 Tax=Macrostomum lignano TaxID=282301 RepID=A0A267H508_9PLAT|nr:hypothetical protein BOX15_Mlig002333g1 [Macrostomum lignano]
MTALFLLLELLLLLGSSKLAVGADSRCSGRPGSQFCLVGGALDVSCSSDTASLVLKFQSVASWPASAASPGRGLVGCDSVDHLKVTGWQGPELESGHTAQLPNLSSMEILDGNLTTVGPDVCGKRLRQLSLARNRVRDLSQRALIGCGSLESLDLSENRIERLPDGLLAACGSLRTLKLSGNRLSQLGPRALQGAVSLFELHALGNQFRTLGSLERAFASNQRLSLIDLRDNELFAYLPASDDGLCGPENVTVRLHFAGCPPAPATDAAVCETVRRHRCLGSSAHLLVTFTSCQVPIATECSVVVSEVRPPAVVAQQQPEPTSVNAKAATPTTPACPSVATATVASDCRFFTRLSEAAVAAKSDPAVWLLIALAGTVLFALLQLLVSLAVCHRLKLRLARLQVRAEQLARECSSHQSFCHNHRSSMLCSRQSGLSGGRMTPSGRGPSSHCGGISEFGDSTVPTFATLTAVHTMPQQPLLTEKQGEPDSGSSGLPDSEEVPHGDQD